MQKESNMRTEIHSFTTGRKQRDLTSTNIPNAQSGFSKTK